MGCVCSCLASTFMVLGEVCETLFLAIGEVGAILIRGLFGLIVGLCDVLAACACCCQVPFSERPDRGTYTYSSLHKSNVGSTQVLLGGFTKQGRRDRAVRKELRKKEHTEKVEAAKAQREATKEPVTLVDSAKEDLASEKKVSEESDAAPAPAAAPVNKGWFGGFFGGADAPAVAAAPAATEAK